MVVVVLYVVMAAMNRERLSCSIVLLIAAAIFWPKRGGREGTAADTCKCCKHVTPLFYSSRGRLLEAGLEIRSGVSICEQLPRAVCWNTAFIKIKPTARAG